MNKEQTTNTLVIELDSDEEEYHSLYGTIEKSLRIIEEALDVKASSRGNKIFLRGDERNVRTAERVIRDLKYLGERAPALTPEDLRYAIRSLSEGGESSLKDILHKNIQVSSKRRFIIPKSENQKRYVEAIREFDIVIGIGPAGTGKTYLAMAMAINAFLRKQVSRIVLARPAIEAGERLGFLPGDMFEKVNPYLRPLYDALYDMMEAEKALRLIEKGIKVMGIDAITWDRPVWSMFENKMFWESHRVMIDHEYYHIENMMNLEKLLERPFGFKVSALPIKWVGTTASPIRAIAIYED